MSTPSLSNSPTPRDIDWDTQQTLRTGRRTGKTLALSSMAPPGIDPDLAARRTLTEEAQLYVIADRLIEMMSPWARLCRKETRQTAPTSMALAIDLTAVLWHAYTVDSYIACPSRKPEEHLKNIDLDGGVLRFACRLSPRIPHRVSVAMAVNFTNGSKLRISRPARAVVCWSDGRVMISPMREDGQRGRVRNARVYPAQRNVMATVTPKNPALRPAHQHRMP